MKKFEFDGEILQSDEVGSGAFVLFPYDTLECFEKKNMIKVQCTFDGVPYRGSIANMGIGPCIGVLKSIRKSIGKEKGDMVHVVVWEDNEERIIEVPNELQEAFDQNKGAEEFFKGLSYSNKKQYVDFVASAKKEETRKSRIETVIEKLNSGVKRLK